MASFERKIKKNPIWIILIVFLVIFISVDFIAGWIFIPVGSNDFRCKHPYYHHDLKPNQSAITTWNGKDDYTFFTNSLGFRDQNCREIVLHSDKRRILLIGDSHTEGVGVTYEDSFAGRLASAVDTTKIEILNAGVVGYSPKLYYNKVKYLIEHVGLRFDKLFVFLDISDIQNELVYEKFFPKQESWSSQLFTNVNTFYKNNSFFCHSISNLLSQRKKKSFYEKRNQLTENQATDLYYTFFDHFGDDELLQTEAFHTIGSWYLDKRLFNRWGRKGLILEKWYMDKLAELCDKNQIELFVSIHPWPIQIVAGDWNSIQVQFWQKFAYDYDVQLINFFDVLHKELKNGNIIKMYYLEKDVHFNAIGHKMIALELLKYIN
jgi:hypothetical protein